MNANIGNHLLEKINNHLLEVIYLDQSFAESMKCSSGNLPAEWGINTKRADSLFNPTSGNQELKKSSKLNLNST